MAMYQIENLMKRYDLTLKEMAAVLNISERTLQRYEYKDVLSKDDFVLVHDAARPCLRFEDLNNLIEQASQHPVGALLAGKMKDTVKRADQESLVEGTLDRSLLWRAFTPQMFSAISLQRALQHAKQEGVQITDESSAMERLGLSPLLVEGSDDNIKVTLASDFALAEAILSARNS